MKALACALLLASLGIVRAAPPTTGTVSFSWDYPADQLTSKSVFRLYTSTNILKPLALWTPVADLNARYLRTNLIGGNRLASAVKLTVKYIPGTPHFFVIGASNVLGSKFVNSRITR